MSPQHREPDGTRRTAHSWESLVERQIREAMEQGAFDDLPHQGAPLPTDDHGSAGEWGLAYKMLKDAGAVPPWIEADKEARRALAAIESMMDRARHAPTSLRSRYDRELVGLVAAANDAIERLNGEAPTNRQHRRLVDGTALSARLDDVIGSAL